MPQTDLQPKILCAQWHFSRSCWFCLQAWALVQICSIQPQLPFCSRPVCALDVTASSTHMRTHMHVHAHTPRSLFFRLTLLTITEVGPVRGEEMLGLLDPLSPWPTLCPCTLNFYFVVSDYSMFRCGEDYIFTLIQTCDTIVLCFLKMAFLLSLVEGPAKITEASGMKQSATRLKK